MTGAALVDTNILVYRFDPRFPDKQRRATAALRRGLSDDVARVPHQAIVGRVRPGRAMYTDVRLATPDVPIVQRPRIQPFQG